MPLKSRPIVMGYNYQHSGLPSQDPKFSTFEVGIWVPDLKRNFQHPDGWRAPSAYSARTNNGAGVYNTISVEGWGPGYTAFFEGNGLGIRTHPFALNRAAWVLPALPIVSQFPKHLEARAVNTALKQLQNRQGNILESIAELKSSLHGIARLSRSMARYVDAFELSVRQRNTEPMRRFFNLPRDHPKLREWKRKLNGASLTAKTFASSWLTFWFGLAPIVDDMVLIMRILGDSNLFQQNLNGKGRGFARTQVSTRSNWFLRGTSDGFGGTNGGFRGTCTVQRELGVYVSLTCNLNKEAVERRCRQAAQLGAFDVATTAWALVPYSWLVDFVLPLGQYLKSWEGRQGLDFRGGTLTHYQAYSNPKVTYEKRWPRTSIIDVGSPQMFGERTFNRSVYTSLPAPVFSARVPSDLWKATTALSLLVTKLNPYLGR